MKCPACGAEMIGYEERKGRMYFACGSVAFGMSNLLDRREKCYEQEFNAELQRLRKFREAVIAADSLPMVSAIADEVRRLCKGER